MKNRLCALFTVGVLLFVGSQAEAAGQGNMQNWYLGAGLGPADLDVGLARFDDGSLDSSGVDDSDLGWKVVAGFQRGRRLGLELGFVNLNSGRDDHKTFAGASNGTGLLYPAGDVSVDIEPEVKYLAAVITLFGRGKTFVYGKYGYTEWEADVTTVDSVGVISDNRDGSDTMYGFGIEYGFRSGVALRAEWERYGGIAGTDPVMISGNFLFRFRPRR